MADNINAAGYETKPWWPYVRALMEGGGNVTVEQLNVTENGTYTAEVGKAYSPVVVNVESDLTTATLTIVVGSNIEEFAANVIYIAEATEIPFPLPARLDSYLTALPDQENVYKVVLYQGEELLVQATENVSMTVTGDGEVTGNICRITGDCTITVSAVGG